MHYADHKSEEIRQLRQFSHICSRATSSQGTVEIKANAFHYMFINIEITVNPFRSLTRLQQLIIFLCPNFLPLVKFSSASQIFQISCATLFQKFSSLILQVPGRFLPISFSPISS